MTDFFLSSALPSVTTPPLTAESFSKLFWSGAKNPLCRVLIWSCGGLFLIWLLNCLEILGFWLRDLSDISILLGRMGLKSFLASTLSDSTILGIGLPLKVLSDYIGVSRCFYLPGSPRYWDRPVDLTRVLKTWWISRKDVGSLGSSGFDFVRSSGRGALRMIFWLW